MKKNVHVIFVSCIIALFFTTVSCGKKQEELRTEMKNLSEEIDSAFVKIRISSAKISDFIAELFKNQGKYDLSIMKMDEKDGGRFRWFENTVYYLPEKEKDMCSIFATGYVPVDDAVKKRIRLIENVQNILKSTYREVELCSHVSILTADALALHYPYRDLLSTVKNFPKTDFQSFPWFQMADPANNPGKKPVWSPGVMGSIAGGGWITNCSSPVYHGNTFEGIASMTVSVDKLRKKFIQDRKHIVILTSSDLTMIASSRMCKDVLKLGLDSLDYLEQLKVNPKIGEQMNLSHSSQPEGVRELAGRIKKGKSEFEVNIHGKTYLAVVGKVKETGFYVIGLAEK